MTTLTSAQLARLNFLVRRGVSYRDALVLSDTMVQADLDAAVSNGVVPAAGLDNKPLKWNNTAQAYADATADLLATFESVFNVNTYGAGSAKTSAQNKTAIQAAITAAQAVTSGRRVVFFPDQSYSVDAGLAVTSSSVEFEGCYGGTDAGDGTSFTILYFQFAAVGGTGTGISIGTDDGQAYDANDYSGHENTQFRRLTLKYAGGATTETALVNTPGISYGAACYGVRDWRGGSMVNEDLGFIGFDRGFWGVVSDLNIWRRCTGTNCNIAYYIDARSDQNTFYDFFPYGNDTAITVDGAHQTRFYGASFVGNGSLTTSAVALRAAYSRGNVGTLFDGCWFEQFQRANVVSSFISIGGFSTYQVTGVRIINPAIMTNSVAPQHVKYFIDLNNCDDVSLENPTGLYGIGVDYLFHVPTGDNYTPHVNVKLGQPYNSHAMLLNEGTSTVTFAEYVAGNGDHILRATSPRLRVQSEPAQAERDWFIDAPADDRWVVQQPGRADGNAILLDIRRHWIDGAGIPTTGTWTQGDFVKNISRGPAGIFGWACTAGGTFGGSAPTFEAVYFGTPYVTQTTQTASYTLVLTDASTVVEMNSSSANNLTVPPNSSVAFPVGTTIVGRQLGSGLTTVVAGAGVTVNSRGAALKSGGQYAEWTLTKRATDTWILSGDIST